MASLIDNLITTLNSENDQYQKLLKLSDTKTDAIVKGDLDSLTKVTDNEQDIVSTIQALEKERTKTMREIAKILNTDVAALKLDTLIALLDKTPREQSELAKVHDALHNTLFNMKVVNERNEQLLKSALEMVDFNLNLVQSMKKAPETANYNRGAYSTGTELGVATSGFDAKQ